MDNITLIVGPEIMNNPSVTNGLHARSLIGLNVNLTRADYAFLTSGGQIERFGVKLGLNHFEELVEEEQSLDAVAKEDNKIKDVLNSKFHKAEDVITCLIDGFRLKKHVLFHGPGGYGKSEITIAFFDELIKRGIIPEEDRPFVVSLGEGTTDDELFGGTDIKLLQEKGILKYNIENSFMNYKYVIFEEMFDAHASTLLSLKDIITSKHFRKGTQNEPIKTEMIIGLTNKSKSDFSTDDSKKAFADRFTYSLKVHWANPDISDYVSLFNKIFPKASPEVKAEHGKLADIIHSYNNETNMADIISPRVAYNIADIHMKGRSIKYIEGLSDRVIDIYNAKVHTGLEEDPLQVATALTKNFMEYICVKENIVATQCIPTPLTSKLIQECVYSMITTGEVKNINGYVNLKKYTPLESQPQVVEAFEKIKSTILALVDAAQEEDDKSMLREALCIMQIDLTGK